MHQREYTVFLRPRDNGITLHTMFYANEVAHVEEYGKIEDGKINPQEVKLAEQLVLALAGDFNIKEYKDEYQERLDALIDAKLKGKSIAVSPEVPVAPVIDIMQALKQSLAASKPGPKQAPAAEPKKARRKAG
jgi:DNA end-binding protein Ku